MNNPTAAQPRPINADLLGRSMDYLMKNDVVPSSLPAYEIKFEFIYRQVPAQDYKNPKNSGLTMYSYFNALIVVHQNNQYVMRY